MNRKYRNILIILFITTYFIISIPSKSNAGLQANKGGTSLTNVNANGFFVSIRRMESQNGTLGKNATFDQTSYVDSSGNGIDSHMALNTEFGTAGILAYSEYGFIPTVAKDTTTGNESGIYNLAHKNWEYVAGLYPGGNSYTNIIANSDRRYYNIYEKKVSISGDAMGKLGFYGNFPTNNPNYNIILRAGNGILYSNSEGYPYPSSGNADYTSYSGTGKESTREDVS